MNQQDSYQEGWQEASDHFLKTHVPMEDIVESIDKLLDKINRQNKLLSKVQEYLSQYLEGSESVNSYYQEVEALRNKIADELQKGQIYAKEKGQIFRFNSTKTQG
jgi:uncharacterized protein Yka (UPF0111/DUF47 family)